MILLWIYIIGWVLFGIAFGFIEHETKEEFGFYESMRAGSHALFWPLMIFLVFPYIGAFISDFRAKNKQTKKDES
jgi:hypothetical protein